MDSRDAATLQIKDERKKILSAFLDIYKNAKSKDSVFSRAGQGVATFVMGGVYTSQKLKECETLEGLFDTQLDTHDGLVDLCLTIGNKAHDIIIADKSEHQFTTTCHALLHYLRTAAPELPELIELLNKKKIDADTVVPETLAKQLVTEHFESEQKVEPIAQAFLKKIIENRQVIAITEKATELLMKINKKIDKGKIKTAKDDSIHGYQRELVYLGDACKFTRECFPPESYSYDAGDPVILSPNFIKNYIQTNCPEIKSTSDYLEAFIQASYLGERTNQVIKQRNKTKGNTTSVPPELPTLPPKNKIIVAKPTDNSVDNHTEEEPAAEEEKTEANAEAYVVAEKTEGDSNVSPDDEPQEDDKAELVSSVPSPKPAKAAEQKAVATNSSSLTDKIVKELLIQAPPSPSNTKTPPPSVAASIKPAAKSQPSGSKKTKAKKNPTPPAINITPTTTTGDKEHQHLSPR